MTGADTTEKRRNIFWSTCIPTRALLAFAAYAASFSSRGLQLSLSFYLAAWGVGFMYFFVRKEVVERKVDRLLSVETDATEREKLVQRRETVRYGNFGGVVWWQGGRVVHSCLLLLYAGLTLLGERFAYLFLIADLTYGAFAGALYYATGRAACPFA